MSQIHLPASSIPPTNKLRTLVLGAPAQPFTSLTLPHVSFLLSTYYVLITACSLQSEDGTIIIIQVGNLTQVSASQCPQLGSSGTGIQTQVHLNPKPVPPSLSLSLLPHASAGLRNPAPGPKLTQSSPSHSLIV